MSYGNDVHCTCIYVYNALYIYTRTCTCTLYTYIGMWSIILYCIILCTCKIYTCTCTCKIYTCIYIHSCILVCQVSKFDDVLKEIDHRTGIAKCLDIISRLEYIHDDQVSVEKQAHPLYLLLMIMMWGSIYIYIIYTCISANLATCVHV